MEHHYAFSLGLIPVQEFISEARRSKDLRAGSAILSWMMYKVLTRLKTFGVLKLLLPVDAVVERLNGQTFSTILRHGEYSIPNRASGFYSADTPEVFQILEKECVQETWQSIVLEILKEDTMADFDTDGKGKAFLETILKIQPCPIQLVWAILPASSIEYNDPAYNQVDELYSNIKRTRPIQNWQGMPVGKCLQCGKREMANSIFPNKSGESKKADHEIFDEWWSWQKQFRESKWVASERRINATEHLCGICLTKRFAGYLAEKDFPSTNHVALRYWISKIRQITDEKAYLHLKHSIQETKWDDPSRLYFFRNIQTMKQQNQKSPHVLSQLDKIHAAHEALGTAIRLSNCNLKDSSSNYLALIEFDGDGIGELMRKHINTLPAEMLEFNQAIQEVMIGNENEYMCEFFYLGGDEGLLMCPIESMLKTAQKINSIFNEILKIEATLSMGIVLFDRERPLGSAIEQVHEAIRQSKKMDHKNALTISVQTASGNVFSATAKWGPAWQRIENALALILDPDASHRLSRSWCFAVEEFLQQMQGFEWGDGRFRYAVRQEIRRLTKRKLKQLKFEGADAKRTFNTIWEEDLYGDIWFKSAEQAETRESISNLLHVLSFLVRESGLVASEVDEKIEEVTQ